jgi:hypothetical protein
MPVSGVFFKDFFEIFFAEVMKPQRAYHQPGKFDYNRVISCTKLYVRIIP